MQTYLVKGQARRYTRGDSRYTQRDSWYTRRDSGYNHGTRSYQCDSDIWKMSKN